MAIRTQPITPPDYLELNQGLYSGLNLVVCIKQVPTVSELPWDPHSGTLRRELADGMLNPACRHALEAALQIKSRYGAYITAITMGPAMAEEVLREALALGADRGVLLTDPAMAGADTSATAFTLARAIEKTCPKVDLVLCGCQTSDSETAQVGPQLAEELDLPGVAYVEQLELHLPPHPRAAANHTAAPQLPCLRLQRLADGFLETLEMDLPGLITVGTQQFTPRHVSLIGLQNAFETVELLRLTAADLGLALDCIGRAGSPTRILDVYSPTAGKQNLQLKGPARKVVARLFDTFGDQLSGAFGKDLKTHDHDDDTDESVDHYGDDQDNVGEEI